MAVNDILEIITSRRSVTKYLPKPVEWEHITRMMDAARHAPSCGNLQNWKFVVVTEPGKRKQIAEAALQQYWMVTAPVHVIVCADPEKAERYYGVRGERLYSVQNCSAAVMCMILEAQSLGLSTCWVGAFDEGMLKRIITTEEHIRPQAIVTVGYAAEHPPRPPKYPLNETIYFEHWRGRVKDAARYMRDYSLVWQRELQKGAGALKQLGGKLQEKLRGQPPAPETHPEELAPSGQKHP